MAALQDRLRENYKYLGWTTEPPVSAYVMISPESMSPSVWSFGQPRSFRPVSRALECRRSVSDRFMPVESASILRTCSVMLWHICASSISFPYFPAVFRLPIGYAVLSRKRKCDGTATPAADRMPVLRFTAPDLFNNILLSENTLSSVNIGKRSQWLTKKQFKAPRKTTVSS